MVHLYAAGAPQKMRLRDHLLMRYRLWQHQRKWRESEIPSFYKRAKHSDVEGLVIRGDSWTVGDFLPEGFEAYVQLPNPFWKIVPPNTEGAVHFEPEPGENAEDQWAKPLRHSEIAEAHGLRVTEDSDWGAICRARDAQLAASQNEVWSWPPHECNIEPFVAEALFQMLVSESGPNCRCLSGQWEGGSANWDTDVLLVTRGWSYFVWRARLKHVAAWLQRPYSYERDLHIPHIIWPADRKWCLATLYSADANLLAGSRSLIDRVLSSELEAYSVELTDTAS